MRTQTRAAAHLLYLALVSMAFVLPLVAQTAAAPGLAGAFARMDKTAQQFKGIAADVKRDNYTAVIGDHERDAGTIKVKREKSNLRMLIVFTGADAKAVSLDGSKLSLYYPKIKTVQIYDIGAKRDQVDQFLLLGFGATSEELKLAYDVAFAGMEPIDGTNAWHLQLVPKSKDVLQHLKKAELWIGETSGLPLQQKFILSSTGDYQLVTYSNMKFKPLSDGDLKLSYPKGTTVEHPQL